MCVCILLLEDNSGDAYLIEQQLGELDDFEFEIVEAQYLEDAIALLQKRHFDAILLDLMLPDSQGLETFFEIDRQAPGTAIIVISAMSEKDLAIQAVRQGAQDYIAKGKIQSSTLGKTIQYAIERKSIAEQLRKRTAELEYLNQELEAFNSAVSHDLKNPLSFIKGMSHLLLTKKRSQPLSEQDQMCIERIYQSSVRMQQITQNLLNLSQVQRSQISLEKVNLSELVEEICDRLQQEKPERKVNTRIAKNIIATVDRQLFILALENLINNAWKYTQSSDRPTIEFGAHESQPNTYYLKDNGIGFDPEEASELFQPFQRLSNSRKYEGTGIGLATVKRIIDRHHGKIWFSARPEQGVTFWFTLNNVSLG
jgi:two-component system sensor histidine kinase/response regulator